jgi:hypothetical protein
MISGLSRHYLVSASKIGYHEQQVIERNAVGDAGNRPAED